MVELIDRAAANAALENLDALMWHRAETEDEEFIKVQVGITLASCEIEALPTIDAVPVVRCRDCRHSSRIASDTTGRMRHCWSGRGRNNGDGFSRVKRDGFCDEGERKEGEHGTDRPGGSKCGAKMDAEED
jgi:hypothetical protein